MSAPPQCFGPGSNHVDWTEGGTEEEREKSLPRLPPPFSLLCNLLISFRRETGALHPRKGGGGFPPGPHAGKGCPPFLLPIRGAQVFLLRPKGGEGGLAATSLAPCATRPCPSESSCQSPGSFAGGVPGPYPVSRVPGAFPSPVLWPCPRPWGKGRRCAPLGPLRLRGLHGRILSTMPLSDVAWEEGGLWGNPRPRLSASWPQASLSDHG